MSQLETQEAPPVTAGDVDDGPLTDHAYDGIQEYDNPMPGWWSWLFIATIVFSVIYFFIAVVSGGQLGANWAYDQDVMAETRRQFGAGEIHADAPTLLRLSHDPEMLKSGAAVFATNCIACHAKDGSGLIGPNLTDDKYINVTKIEDIFDVVAKGRNNGQMPAWENRLNPTDRVLVSAYVASLRGQNKPGKPPEPNAKEIPAWSAQ
jgi:cytochrome c oxidase cbb3-type subunit 3